MEVCQQLHDGYQTEHAVNSYGWAKDTANDNLCVLVN